MERRHVKPGQVDDLVLLDTLSEDAIVANLVDAELRSANASFEFDAAEAALVRRATEEQVRASVRVVPGRGAWGQA